MCGCAKLDVWMCGCMDFWMFGYSDIRIFGFLDFWIFGGWKSEVGSWKSDVGCWIFGKQRLDWHLIMAELTTGAVMASEAIHPDKDG